MLSVIVDASCVKGYQMKKQIICIFLLITTIGIELGQNDFTTEPISEAEKIDFAQAVPISVIDDSVKTYEINCFDVNQNHQLALGFTSGENHVVKVIDNVGNYSCILQFSYPGGFQLEWHDEMLVVYFTRSSIAAWIDSDGKYADIRKYTLDTENNSYWNEKINVSKKEIGNITYILKNKINIISNLGTYDELVKIDHQGEVVVLYESTINRTVIIAGTIMILAVGGVISIGLLVRKNIKKNHK